MSNADAARLLVGIVDRGKGSALTGVYSAQGLPYACMCMGHGTANSKMLDYLGLSETRKDIVLAFAPHGRVRDVMAAADVRFDLSAPGRGILFSVPLSGLSGRIHQALGCETAPQTPKEEPVRDANAYDLVVAVVDADYTDAVMDAARAAGARGGTVMHGRRLGLEEGGRPLGIEPEREVVSIVCPHAQKLDIMRAVSGECGPSTPARGILFSVPVEDMMGLQPVLPPEGANAPADPARPDAPSTR